MSKSADALPSNKEVMPSRGGFLRESLPTFLVLLVLCGIGYWGYRTEWKIPGFSSRTDPGSDDGDAPERQTAVKVVSSNKATKDCPAALTRLEFQSAAAARRAGIRTAAADARPLEATLAAPAEVDYDPTRVARLSSPVPGRVWRIEKEVGQRVRKGDVLVLLDAAKVGDAKAEFLQSLTQVELKTTAVESLQKAGEGIAQRRLVEAGAEVRDSRIRLFNAEQALINLELPLRSKDLVKLSEGELTDRVRFLGLPDSLVKSLDPDTATSNLLPLKAPFDGVVTERLAAAGEVVDPAKLLFVVADLSRVWVVMNFRQEDADQLALGQPVAFAPDGHPNEAVRGKLSWVSTTVDEKTRQLRARAEVDNPKEHLPARTFGTARVTVRSSPQAVFVPEVAVQREGPCQFVFVLLADGVFQLRPVRSGAPSDDAVEIIDGLSAGEVVATIGSFVLKSEVFKGRLGGETE